jgi:hypothetical protein
MHSDILQKIKPLSQSQEEELMDFHERELLKMEPLEVNSIRNPKGLIERGLVSTRQYTKGNNTHNVYYVTSLGVYYLAKKCSA